MPEQILIVDDEEMIRSMQMASLASEGYGCHTAANADKAVEILRKHPVDLALLDITMPGRSGVQLLTELKEEFPEVAAIMVTAIDDLQTATYCIEMGADDYIVKPFSMERMILSVRNALQRRRLALENRAYQQNLEEKVQQQTEEIRQTLARLSLAYSDTLSSLARALDAREREVSNHSERVQAYALHLGKEMGMLSAELDELARGALLHDIGKIGIPDGILLKPGKLTEEEWEQMRRHPQVGHDIIAEIGFLQGAAQIVFTHHERFDGGGYPRGLKGEEIPLGARIFALADTLDAMTSDRPYRKALPFQAVTEEVRRCSGSQFDPQLAELFLAIDQKYWERIGGRRFS